MEPILKLNKSLKVFFDYENCEVQIILLLVFLHLEYIYIIWQRERLLMCLQHSLVTSLSYQFLETNMLQNSLKTKYFLFAQLMKGDSRGPVTSLAFASIYDRKGICEKYLIRGLNLCHNVMAIGRTAQKNGHILSDFDFYDVSRLIHFPTFHQF